MSQITIPKMPKRTNQLFSSKILRRMTLFNSNRKGSLKVSGHI